MLHVNKASNVLENDFNINCCSFFLDHNFFLRKNFSISKGFDRKKKNRRNTRVGIANVGISTIRNV